MRCFLGASYLKRGSEWAWENDITVYDHLTDYETCPYSGWSCQLWGRLGRPKSPKTAKTLYNDDWSTMYITCDIWLIVTFHLRYCIPMGHEKWAFNSCWPYSGWSSQLCGRFRRLKCPITWYIDIWSSMCITSISGSLIPFIWDNENQ